MAWRLNRSIEVQGTPVVGHVRDGPVAGEVEVTIPWRPGVTPGDLVALGGDAVEIVGVRDPGGRHEILELLTRPVGRVPGEVKRRAWRPTRPRARDDRLAAIRAVIAELDLDDPAHVTGDGRPDANVLSEQLGWRVSARERDQAWKEMTDHDR